MANQANNQPNTLYQRDSVFKVKLKNGSSITDLTFQLSKFPDGWSKFTFDKFVEIELKEANKEINKCKVYITVDFLSQKDFFPLLNIVDTVKNLFGGVIVLSMPYLPNARADRRMSTADSAALEVFLKALHAVGGRKLTVSCNDAHNEDESLYGDYVTLDSQDQAISFTTLLQNSPSVRNLMACSVIVRPDKGAANKNLPAVSQKVINLQKSRFGDKISHSFSRLEDYACVDGKHVVIVDDLCDAGGTYLSVAKLLKDHGAAKVSLYVTHGLFTKGLHNLFENGIDNVVCCHVDKNVVEEAYMQYGESLFKRFAYGYHYQNI